MPTGYQAVRSSAGTLTLPTVQLIVSNLAPRRLTAPAMSRRVEGLAESKAMVNAVGGSVNDLGWIVFWR